MTIVEALRKYERESWGNYVSRVGLLTMLIVALAAAFVWALNTPL